MLFLSAFPLKSRDLGSRQRISVILHELAGAIFSEAHNDANRLSLYNLHRHKTCVGRYEILSARIVFYPRCKASIQPSIQISLVSN